MTSTPLILRRIDAALTIMAAENMAVRGIYLQRTDLEQFLAAQPVIRRPVQHRGYDVRPVKGVGVSKVYSTHGVARVVPKAI